MTPETQQFLDAFHIKPEHVYPKIAANLDAIREATGPVTISGDLGTGKTFLSRLVMLQKIYDLSAGGTTPQAKLGMIPHTTLLFVVVSDMPNTAMEAIYSMLDEGPFKGRVLKKMEDCCLPFNIFIRVVPPTSRVDIFRGMNVVGAVFDCSNYNPELWDGLSIRVRSRARWDGLLIKVEQAGSLRIHLDTEP